MPFGLKTAPYYFTRILKPVLGYLREKFSVQIFAYLDDLLVLGDSFDKTAKDLQLTKNFLQFLGFKLNPKSTVTPVEQFIYLGVEFNLNNKLMFNTSQNKSKISDRITSLMQKSLVTKRDMEKLIGHLNFITKYVVNAKFQMHDLLSFLYSLNREDRDKKISFPEEIRRSLNYWLMDENYSPVDIRSRQTDVTIFSDASKEAWSGLIAKNYYTQPLTGKGSSEVRKLHINLKELMAVNECISLLPFQMANVDIDWFLDNTSAISWLRKEGNHRNPKVNEIILQIKKTVSQKNLRIKFNYIPSKMNTSANLLSRSKHWMPTNLQVSKELFNQACNALQVNPTIDMFADPSTFKIKRYVSSIPSKEAVALNAFSMNWNSEHQIYAFPPIELIGRILHKWKLEGEVFLLLIAPDWRT